MREGSLAGLIYRRTDDFTAGGEMLFSTACWKLYLHPDEGAPIEFSVNSRGPHCGDNVRAKRIDLLEILEDRNGRGSTLVTSQVPIDQWCDVIGDPTLADAILDRFVHNAHRLNLTGESMRRANGKRSLDAGQNA